MVIDLDCSAYTPDEAAFGIKDQYMRMQTMEAEEAALDIKDLYVAITGPATHVYSEIFKAFYSDPESGFKSGKMTLQEYFDERVDEKINNTVEIDTGNLAEKRKVQQEVEIPFRKALDANNGLYVANLMTEHNDIVFYASAIKNMFKETRPDLNAKTCPALFHIGRLRSDYVHGKKFEIKELYNSCIEAICEAKTLLPKSSRLETLDVQFPEYFKSYQDAKSVAYSDCSYSSFKRTSNKDLSENNVKDLTKIAEMWTKKSFLCLLHDCLKINACYLSDVFVFPVIQYEHTYLEQLEDIFTLLSDSAMDNVGGMAASKVIFISGKTGSGRSTLLQQLVKFWLQGNFREQFELMFFLELKCIKDLYYYLRDSMPNCLHQLTPKNFTLLKDFKILLIIDGFDAIYDDGKLKNIVQNFPNCSIVISTALDDLEAARAHLVAFSSRNLIIKGFNRDQCIQFATKFVEQTVSNDKNCSKLTYIHSLISCMQTSSSDKFIKPFNAVLVMCLVNSNCNSVSAEGYITQTQLLSWLFELLMQKLSDGKSLHDVSHFVDNLGEQALKKLTSGDMNLLVTKEEMQLLTEKISDKNLVKSLVSTFLVLQKIQETNSKNLQILNKESTSIISSTEKSKTKKKTTPKKCSETLVEATTDTENYSSDSHNAKTVENTIKCDGYFYNETVMHFLAAQFMIKQLCNSDFLKEFICKNNCKYKRFLPMLVGCMALNNKLDQFVDDIFKLLKEIKMNQRLDKTFLCDILQQTESLHSLENPSYSGSLCSVIGKLLNNEKWSLDVINYLDVVWIMRYHRYITVSEISVKLESVPINIYIWEIMSSLIDALKDYSGEPIRFNLLLDFRDITSCEWLSEMNPLVHMVNFMGHVNTTAIGKLSECTQLRKIYLKISSVEVFNEVAKVIKTSSMLNEIKLLMSIEYGSVEAMEHLCLAEDCQLDIRFEGVQSHHLTGLIDMLQWILQSPYHCISVVMLRSSLNFSDANKILRGMNFFVYGALTVNSSNDLSVKQQEQLEAEAFKEDDGLYQYPSFQYKWNNCSL